MSYIVVYTERRQWKYECISVEGSYWKALRPDGPSLCEQLQSPWQAAHRVGYSAFDIPGTQLREKNCDTAGEHKKVPHYSVIHQLQNNSNNQKSHLIPQSWSISHFE